MGNLTLETSVDGGAAVIALHGELDLAGAITLEHELEQLEESPEHTIVLDLRGVEFMDSSGLRVIAVAAQRAESRGHRLALVPGTEQVMRVFDITRMRERLDFVAEPGEAVGGG